jgi:transposase
VLEETSQTEEIVERVAALDVGKAELACCVRVPGRAGKRLQEVTTHKTMTRSLLVLADRLATLGVPGWCWRPPATTGRPPLRHEAPRIRAEVKGLRLRHVAAGR